MLKHNFHLVYALIWWKRWCDDDDMKMQIRWKMESCNWWCDWELSNWWSREICFSNNIGNCKGIHTCTLISSNHCPHFPSQPSHSQSVGINHVGTTKKLSSLFYFYILLFIYVVWYTFPSLILLLPYVLECKSCCAKVMKREWRLGFYFLFVFLKWSNLWL